MSDFNNGDRVWVHPPDAGHEGTHGPYTVLFLTHVEAGCLEYYEVIDEYHKISSYTNVELVHENNYHSWRAARCN